MKNQCVQEELPVKRKRGRPAKIKDCYDMKYSHMLKGEASTNAPQNSGDTTEKRKRGRPKKTDKAKETNKRKKNKGEVVGIRQPLSNETEVSKDSEKNKN